MRYRDRRQSGQNRSAHAVAAWDGPNSHESRRLGIHPEVAIAAAGPEHRQEQFGARRRGTRSGAEFRHVEPVAARRPTACRWRSFKPAGGCCATPRAGHSRICARRRALLRSAPCSCYSPGSLFVRPANRRATRSRPATHVAVAILREVNADRSRTRATHTLIPGRRDIPSENSGPWPDGSGSARLHRDGSTKFLPER